MKSPLMLLLLCSPALADDSARSPWITTNGVGILAIQRPQSMIISCGKGSVSISVDDGSVKFTDCSPDDGAKAFWKAMRAMYGVGCPVGTDPR